MKEQTLGSTIAALRKEKGMTQQALAEKMGVTDKAVSKWERDLSCPDVSSLPKLAEELGVSLDALMNCKPALEEPKQTQALLVMICRCVALAMGVAVVVLSAMNQLDVQSGLGMLGVGLVALSLQHFLNK